MSIGPETIVSLSKSHPVLRAANSWRCILGAYLGATFIGAGIFDLMEEGQSFWDGIWWAVITSLTIGYGDLYPVTTVGRLTGIALAHIVTLVIIPLVVANFTLRLIVDFNEFTHQEQEELKARSIRTEDKLDRLLAAQGSSYGPQL